MRESTTAVLMMIALTSFAACKPPQSSGLLTPNADSLATPAPDSFRVEFKTGKGRFVVQAFRGWAPHGVDRFYYLTKNSYYDRAKFFRTLPNFVTQFGLHGDPTVNAVWQDKNMPDDPVKQSNLPGYVTYAMGGPNTRSVQLFINKRDNRQLDRMGFAPIGRVVEGMEVIGQLYAGYGESPDQERIARQGNTYLNQLFPQLDSIITARILKD